MTQYAIILFALTVFRVGSAAYGTSQYYIFYYYSRSASPSQVRYLPIVDTSVVIILLLSLQKCTTSLGYRGHSLRPSRPSFRRTTILNDCRRATSLSCKRELMQCAYTTYYYYMRSRQVYSMRQWNRSDSSLLGSVYKYIINKYFTYMLYGILYYCYYIILIRHSCSRIVFCAFLFLILIRFENIYANVHENDVVLLLNEHTLLSPNKKYTSSYQKLMNEKDINRM